MKKLIVLFFCLFLGSTQVNSQALIALLFGKSISGPKLEMGLQLGMNASYLLNSGATRALPTFSFGAFTNYKFHEKWTLNTFVSFKSNRGARKMDTIDGHYAFSNDSLEGVSLTRRLSYIDISPEIQYKISPSFAIGFGPVISILTRAFDIYDATKDDATVTYEQKVYKQMNAIDIGAVIDFQFTFSKGRGITLNLKYIQGFVQPFKANSSGTILNSVIYFGVGIPMTGQK